MRTIKVHKGAILSVAFDPKGQVLATGSADDTVKLWEVSSGKLLRTLEGHTDYVDSVAFSKDGKLLASKSSDNTLRIWNCETWVPVAIVSAPECKTMSHTIAFHPTLSLLAVGGLLRYEQEGKKIGLIHLWELDYDVLLGKGWKSRTAKTEAVHHTTAKVVLVGDSGVGKTGLAASAKASLI